MREKSKRIAIIGLYSALALALSYLESLLPLDFAVPGIKPGFANLAVLITLWTLDIPAGFWVNLIRILLAGLLFSSPAVLIYSLCGGILACGTMAICKKSGKFSLPGCSIAGGVAHNLGQTAAALILTRTPQIVGYLPILLISGLITGAINGILASILVSRMPKK